MRYRFEKAIPFFASWLLFIPWLAGANAELSCYEAFYRLRADTYVQDSQTVLSYGSKIPITRAFEKEGLFYSEIALWFDTIDAQKFTERMGQRLQKEAAAKRQGYLHKWLSEYPGKYQPMSVKLSAEEWRAMSPEQQVAFLSSAKNPFDRINVKGREELFLESVLNFDDVRRSDITPSYLGVGDDLGSYEIRSVAGETDRVKYVRDRTEIETQLDSKVGHQHFFHGWPKDRSQREEIAAKYIENLDATSWYLYWRQLKRSPNDAESIVFHPYLGVYNKGMLDRLHAAFVNGEPEKFREKYRMVGSRNFKPLPGTETDGWERIPDFEQRSGNKGDKRDLVADLMEARLSSGRYGGLKNYNEVDFNASTPTLELTSGLLRPNQLEKVLEFEKAFPEMAFNPEKRANNHFRNKVLAPLLPWEKRLPIDQKKEVLARAQKRFATEYYRIARYYLQALPKQTNDYQVGQLRAYVREKLERINWLFARRVRLDEDFEKYLMPMPNKLPSILVKSEGPIDVNQTPIGIEASFRFWESPRTRNVAEKQIREAAEAFGKRVNAVKVERVEDGGHGHGLSIRYLVTDQEGKKWRIEWDGVQRSYDAQGNAKNPHGGHIETPTPKIVPQDMTELSALYQAMRDNGFFPKRSAGGAHFNVGIEQLKNLPEKEAADRMANLMRVFEQNREIIQALWQHPKRERVAIAVPYGQDFVDSINNFKGSWKELEEMLYEKQYFNPYISRKPAYTQMNMTMVMGDAVPNEYKKPIDIKKNAVDGWFPSFAKSGDRIEFRLPDAMPEENMLALQIKFFRALLNKGLNGEKTLLEAKDGVDKIKHWRENPRDFFEDSDRFLAELGLDPDEFRPAQVQAIQQQVPALKADTKPKKPLERYYDYLPVVEERGD